LVVRSTELVDAGDDLEIKRTRTEVKGLYARRQAVSLQLPDGSIVAAGGTPPAESLQTISVSEAEEQSRAGKLVTQITREWGWYNPRGAKLLSLGDPPGTVEDGYYWAETWIDEEGHYRAWRQEGWVQTGERREVPSYDADGTEIGRRTETYRWYSRPMATRHVGESAPTVPGAGVGDDGVSWQIFADVRIEQFGLAQVDEVQRTFDEESGAQLTEAQQTTAWYSARTAVADVPWYLNYSGAGQRDHRWAPDGNRRDFAGFRGSVSYWRPVRLWRRAEQCAVGGIDDHRRQDDGVQRSRSGFLRGGCGLR
jgi:hypothetical protein